MNVFDKFERFGRKTYNGQDILKNHILTQYPKVLTKNGNDYEQVKKYAAEYEYVWLVEDDIEVLRSFPWWFKPKADEKNHVHQFPYVYKSSQRIKSYTKVQLVPTRVDFEGSVQHNHICGIYDVYCGKERFDIFFIGNPDTGTYDDLVDRIRNVKIASSHQEAKERSTTDMFWVVPDDVIVSPIFKFNYVPDDWSQKFTHVFGNGDSDTRDGIALFPKAYNPSDKELNYRYYANKKELTVVASKPRVYPIANIKTYEDYKKVLEEVKADLFWYVPDDVEITDQEIFELYFTHQNQYDRTTNHVFLNGENYDGVALFSKHSPVTEKEFDHRFYANKKEHKVVISKPKKYDQFVVNNYADYKLALERSSTNMFWGIPHDVKVSNNFNFETYFSHHNTYDRNITHVFKNGNTYDGIVLFSKDVELTEREVNHRFYARKKEWDVVASTPKSFDVFNIDTYEQYLDAIENSTTDLFWASSANLKILDLEKIENFYISHHEIVDRKQNHSFIHRVEETNYRNGLFLLSKHKKLSKKEIEYRFLAEHKEWDIILSGPVEYDQFNIETYNDYLMAMENSTTELFWATSNNIDWKIPDIYFTHDNEYDRKINHAFEHRVDKKVMYNGLFLLSKHKPVTQKEIEYRHIIGVKEWPVYGSQKTSYDLFRIDTYEQYLEALEKSQTEMFWGYSNNINCDQFDFDLYFTHNNEYDRTTNHNFIHRVGDKDYRNGLFLFSKKSPVTQKEIEYRHLVNAKEWDIVGSESIEYEKYVIETYDEYLEALKYSETEMFWMDSGNIRSEIPKIYFTHDNEYDRKTNHAFIHEANGKQMYNGLFLCSIHAPLTEKEVEHRFIVNAKHWDIVGSSAIDYPVYVIDSYADYVYALEDSGPEMFWMSSANIDANIPDLYFTHDNDYDRKVNHSFIHRVDGKDFRNGLFLCSKHLPLTEKEVEYRHIVNAKEWDIVASGPKEYEYWEVDSYTDYLVAYDNCETEMFWMGSKNIKPIIPDLYFTHDNVFDRKIHHNFLHCDNKRNGLFLICRDKKLTENEVEHRFIVNAKEWDIVGSESIEYEKYVIETYDEYLDALENSNTEMFWGLTPNVDMSDFDFDLYFTHDNEYDRKINHAFLHCENKFNGIFLFSKHAPVTQKEIEHRHPIARKEWTDRSTGPVKYDVFEIDSFNDYQTALSKTTTEMFWMSSKNITADIPDLYFTHDNEYDRKTNHNFLHCDNKRNGVFLCSKHAPLTIKEVEHRFLVNAKEWDIVASGPKAYDYFDIDSYDEYLEALENSSTEMFWVGSRNIEPMIPDLYFTHDNEYDRSINHAFLHCGKYNGLFLCSKKQPLTSKEVEYRHIVNAKEWDIIGSKEKQYDVFTIDNYNDYLYALDSSTTEMFWGTSANITATIPDVYFTHDNEYDRKQNHNFIHRVGDKEYRNGLFLFSKHKPVTQREIDYRHLVNAKEWDIVGSGPVEYEHFTIDTYDDYVEALDKSKTEMFWGVPGDVAKLIYFRYDMLYFTHDNEYDRKTNHVMLNGEHRDGIVLFSKHAPVTQREVENRFYVNKKDWDIVGSTPKRYDFFNIETYNEYLDALENSTTDMFWTSTPNIKISKDFDLDLYFSHHNTYDRKINHTFVHRANGEDHYNGLFLLSKHAPLTQREVEHRLVAKRKEWNVIASGPVQYDKFVVDTYNDYENALQKSTTEMFWMIPPEVNVDFDFDLYFTHNQWFERETNHVFKNGDAWDGISLVSKKSHITEREINMRFLANKKQYDVVASTPHLYDIVFISKDEEHADANYAKLLERFPRAKRVHGVEGIHAAHIEAAKLCDTDMFWVVDADAEIIDKFAFDYYVPAYDPDSRKTVHVWKSQNPINSLVYGYGAVKLLPRELTLNMDTSKPDMTTSISPLFKTINRISNITRFNTDEFSTWRSAFRETVKLSSRTIQGQLDEETEFRLKAWCTRGKDKPFGEFCISGAILGREYGERNRGNLEALRKINDFNWLHEQFKRSFPQV